MPRKRLQVTDFMHAIWKFHILPNRVNHVTMPTNALILTAQNQHGKLMVWARVDPALPPVMRTLVARLTGDNYDPCVEKHIATVQMDGGDFVLHVFEVF